MKLSSLGYNIKQGLKNIWRNRMFSVASLVTMTATIFLFGVFFSILLNVNAAVKYYEEDVGISVFFNEGVTQDQIDQIGEEIKARPEVANMTFTSAEEAWEKFQEIYFPDDPDAAASFVKGNPLANDASYTVTTNNVEDQPALVAYIKTLDGVRKVNQSDEVVKTLSGFNTLLTYVSVAIIAVLLIVAIILISNTVNVGISVRKNEIGIMKRQDLFVLLTDDTGQDAQKQGKQGHDETDDQDVGFQQKIGVDGRDIGKGIEKLEGNRHDPQGLIPLAQEFACPGCPENQQQNEERYRGCGPQDVRRRFRSGEKNDEGISDPVARHRQDVRRQQGKEGSCRGFPEKEDAQKKKGQMDDQRVGPEDCIEPEGIYQKRLHEQTAKRETGDDRRIFPWIEF